MDNRTIEEVRDNETRLIKEIDELENLNEKSSLALESSEQIIDKAIEYIEKNVVCELGGTCEPFISVPKLLNILRGEEKKMKKIVNMKELFLKLNRIMQLD